MIMPATSITSRKDIPIFCHKRQLLVAPQFLFFVSRLFTSSSLALIPIQFFTEQFTATGSLRALCIDLHPYLCMGLAHTCPRVAETVSELYGYAAMNYIICHTLGKSILMIAQAPVCPCPTHALHSIVLIRLCTFYCLISHTYSTICYYVTFSCARIVQFAINMYM